MIRVIPLSQLQDVSLGGVFKDINSSFSKKKKKEEDINSGLVQLHLM